MEKLRAQLKKVVAQFVKTTDVNELRYLSSEITKLTDKIRVIASEMDQR